MNDWKKKSYILRIGTSGHKEQETEIEMKEHNIQIQAMAKQRGKL